MQANEKLYEGMEIHTKNIRFSPEYRDNQANIQDNDGQGKDQDGKEVFVGENRKSSAFAGHHIFTPASHIERYMECANFRFHETIKDETIMAATNLFGNISF